MGLAETAAGVQAGMDLYRFAKKEGLLDLLLDGLKGRKKHHVLLLGATGTGKSNFLDSLETDLPDAIDHMNRTPEVVKRKTKIGQQPFRFLDTPGQTHHHSKRISAIREAIRTGLSGVINVVCFGHHEYRIGAGEAVTKSDTARQSFLKAHQLKEQESVQEWSALLQASDARWIITLVSKADLWWDQRDEILRHYEHGDYATALRQGTNLHHVVLPYCATFHKFYNRVPLSGHLDDAGRRDLRASFIQSLLLLAVGKA